MSPRRTFADDLLPSASPNPQPELQLVSDIEDVRGDLRSEALKSLFFFCKVILGFSDMTRSCHVDLCDFIQAGRVRLGESAEPRKKLLLIPRGHFKSTCATIGYSLWRVCHDPNIRILISNWEIHKEP